MSAKIISRKVAIEEIKKTINIFSIELGILRDEGMSNSWYKDNFIQYAHTLVENANKANFYSMLYQLDSISFKTFYDQFGTLIAMLGISNSDYYNTYSPVILEDLDAELKNRKKLEDKMELIESFHEEELRAEKFHYEAKMKFISDILDGWFVLEREMECINKVMLSFTKSDKEKFIEKCIAEPTFLSHMLHKIESDCQKDLLKHLMHIGSSADINKGEYEIPKGKVFNAFFVDKKMYLNLLKEVPYEENQYEVDKQVQLSSPFTKVTFFYGEDNKITVPAISLIGLKYDDVLYDDFYKSNIKLKAPL